MNPAEKSFAETIRRGADEIVDEFPHDDLETLARLMEEDIDADEEEVDTTLAIAAELRRRSSAGVRKWAGPTGCDPN
jgi:hypothetical protein